MEIIDNFLPEELFNQLQSTIISDCFPLYFQDVVTDDDKTSDLDKIQNPPSLYTKARSCASGMFVIITSAKIY